VPAAVIMIDAARAEAQDASDIGEGDMNASGRLLASTILALLPAHASLAQATATEVWSLEGFSGPESVAYDEARGILYVSSVAGDMMERNGQGFLSIASLDGEMIRADWVTGLNAPKGLALDGSTLYVADIDRLLAFDVEAGALGGTWQVEGATFLNDLAVAPDGRVFVSDTVGNAIYVLEAGSVSPWLEDAALQHPNGLYVQDGRLIVSAWGQDLQEDFTTLVGGHLLAIDLATREIATLGSGAPVGNLDGLQPDGEGNWLVTDWIAGRLLRVGPGGGFDELADLPMGSADLAYIPGERLAIVPLMLDNRLVAFRLD
jgi:sugar lactone lactonase YvrE